MTVSSLVSWKHWVKLQLCWQSVPRELSHSAESSSYGSFEHMLFQNTFFLFHQGLQHASWYRCLLFIHCTETETEAVILPSYQAGNKGRENVLCQEQTQKTGLDYFYHLKPVIQTTKQGCRIIINLYSYFHSLILNSLVSVNVSTGFLVSLSA